MKSANVVLESWNSRRRTRLTNICSFAGALKGFKKNCDEYAGVVVYWLSEFRISRLVNCGIGLSRFWGGYSLFVALIWVVHPQKIGRYLFVGIGKLLLAAGQGRRVRSSVGWSEVCVWKTLVEVEANGWYWTAGGFYNSRREGCWGVGVGVWGQDRPIDQYQVKISAKQWCEIS